MLYVIPSCMRCVLKCLLVNKDMYVTIYMSEALLTAYVIILVACRKPVHMGILYSILCGIHSSRQQFILNGGNLKPLN
jgi:uncharacterized membrane protein (UPF0136 family)